MKICEKCGWPFTNDKEKCRFCGGKLIYKEEKQIESEEDDDDGEIDLSKKSVAELKELAEQLELEVPDKIKKADLIALIETAAKEDGSDPEEDDDDADTGNS